MGGVASGIKNQLQKNVNKKKLTRIPAGGFGSATVKYSDPATMSDQFRKLYDKTEEMRKNKQNKFNKFPFNK